MPPDTGLAEADEDEEAEAQAVAAQKVSAARTAPSRRPRPGGPVCPGPRDVQDVWDIWDDWNDWDVRDERAAAKAANIRDLLMPDKTLL